MTVFTGTAAQLRLLLRLQRLKIILWPLVFGGLAYAMHDSFRTLYPGQAERDAYAALNEASPVLKAINGPGYGLSTHGGILVFEIGGYLLAVGALLAAFLVVAHTRREEESGRAELVAAAPQGTLAAPAAAALGLVLFAAWTAAVMTGVFILAADLPLRGTLAYTGGLAAIMVLFGAVALVVVQFTARASAASSLAGLLIGVAYAVRAAGDAGDDEALRAASPFGWVQATRPFDDERFWPLFVTVGGAIALTAVAGVLHTRRDLGAGLVQPRPGPARASGWLRGIVSLRIKEFWAGAAGFVVLVFALAALFGAAGEDVTDVFASGDGFGELVGMPGATATDAYLTLVLSLLTLLITAVALSWSQRLRRDERQGLAEAELATPTRRRLWFLSDAATAVAGVAAAVVALGLGLGLAYDAVTDGDGTVGDVLAAALHQLPAALLLVGLSYLLYGLLPRIQPVIWVLFGFCAVVSLLAGALQLEDEVIDLSPFSHMPDLVNDEVGAASIVVLGAALVAVLVGAAGMERRDVPA